MHKARPFLATGLLGLFTAAGFGSSDAIAQQIYRIVGPDGRVTFSDKAPRESDGRATAAPVVALPSGAASDLSSLPFELRQAAARFPVTLYSAQGCVPCASGRALLSSRGIPFAEKTIASNDDIEALKRLSGSGSVPFLTIGGQQLKGFADIEWVQYLDAAGYPKTSQLPPSYTPAPAAPLVAAQQSQPPAAAAPAQATRPADTQPAPAPADNPAAIRF